MNAINELMQKFDAEIQSQVRRFLGFQTQLTGNIIRTLQIKHELYINSSSNSCTVFTFQGE